VFPDQVACGENLEGEIRIPDHPLVNETIDNCLHEAMDLDGLIAILERMEEGTLRTVAIDTPEPSPFSHEILNANPYAYLDDAPLEERRTRAVQLRRSLPPADAAGIGALDPAAIAEVAAQSWPVVREAGRRPRAAGIGLRPKGWTALTTWWRFCADGRIQSAHLRLPVWRSA
jgi:ATP-dependent Lhr-like helicase